MSTLLADAPSSQRRTAPRFFSRSAIAILALVLVSFSFTYYAPLTTGSRRFAPIFHIHALAYFAWIALYAWQTHLVATRRSARHRELGLAGIAISALMLPLGVAMAIDAIHRRMARGDPFPFDNTLYNAVDMLSFAGFMIAGIAAVTRHVDWHRRFTFTAALCLLGPSLSRWLAFIPTVSPWTDMLPNLAADLFFIALVLHDRRSLGRVHPASWIAIVILVPIHIATPMLTGSAWWRGLAPGIDRLMS